MSNESCLFICLSLISSIRNISVLIKVKLVVFGLYLLVVKCTRLSFEMEARNSNDSLVAERESKSSSLNSKLGEQSTSSSRGM